jgi:hypothetical protein
VARDITSQGRQTMKKEHNFLSGNAVETMQSALWPDIHARIWRIGDCWFCQCWSGNYPTGAKTQNFRSRKLAIEHAKIVLAL